MAITDEGLSNVCADLRRVYDLPGEPSGVRRAGKPYRQQQETAEISEESGRLLHFAVTPNRAARPVGSGSAACLQKEQPGLSGKQWSPLVMEQ